MSSKPKNGTSWMHEDERARNQIDREDYLTGKSIDKAFEQFLKQQLADEKLKRTTIDGEKEADIYNKRLEDPLADIRQNEKTMKERYLANPQKMRMLRQVFDEMYAPRLKEKLKKRAAKEKKSKKKKKKKYVSSSSETDSEEENKRDLAELRQESRAKTQRSQDVDKEWNQYNRFKSSFMNRLVHRDPTAGRAYEPDYKQERKNYAFNKGGRIELDERGLPKEEKRKKAAMTKEEKDRKRKAMMKDASNYEEKRKKRSEAETKKEKEEENKASQNSKKGALFLKDVKLGFADNQKLEDRIRSRKSKQLRTSNDLSKNSWA